MARSCRRRRLASAALLVAVVLGLVAAPASASTAALVDVGGPPCKPDVFPQVCPPPETALVYQGGREANRVALAAVVGGIRISDPAAVIQPGRGCSRLDDHAAICSRPTSSVLPTGVLVATNGGADGIRSELDLGVGVDGGLGNDVLVGGPGPDRLFGGRGADRLRGRGGDDRLGDASRRDLLPTGDQSVPAPVPLTLSPGRVQDSFDGGSGNDTISYEGRFAKLRINLASKKALAGARAERDSIRLVENAIGGAGDDRIAGTRAANKLEGGEGDDLLAGGAGGDGLYGGAGNNVIRGGPGNDGIYLQGGAGAERISCGSGSDLAAMASANDFLKDDCEDTDLGVAIFALRLNSGILRLLLPLREGRPPRVLSGQLSAFPASAPQVRLELRVRGPGVRRGTAPRRGTLLGSQSFALAPNEQGSVDLRLSREGLRILRRHRALRVRITVATQYSGASPPGYMTLLRAP